MQQAPKVQNSSCQQLPAKCPGMWCCMLFSVLSCNLKVCSGWASARDTFTGPTACSSPPLDAHHCLLSLQRGTLPSLYSGLAWHQLMSGTLHSLPCGQVLQVRIIISCLNVLEASHSIFLPPDSPSQGGWRVNSEQLSRTGCPHYPMLVIYEAAQTGPWKKYHPGSNRDSSLVNE